jgi:hypothetical protein
VASPFTDDVCESVPPEETKKSFVQLKVDAKADLPWPVTPKMQITSTLS